MNLAAFVLPPPLDAKQALRLRCFGVAGKIMAALAAPFQLGSTERSIDIAASVGIALYPADARDADALVKAADGAMYSAKQAGSRLLLSAA